MNTNTPELTTERLLLRAFTQDDLHAFYEIFSDQEVNTYLPWYPLTSLVEAEQMLKDQYLRIYEEEKGYAYAICFKSDNLPIGYLNVDIEEPYDMGYGLRKEFWHQGIVTEAGQAVIEQLQQDGIPYITATHDINNPRSGAVMKKLGLSYQYTYEEQWQPKNYKVSFRLYQRNLDNDIERCCQKYWEQSTVHYIE